MTRSHLDLLQQARRYAKSGTARRLRVEAGLSQSEIAREVGVTSSAVALWESGKRVPRGEAAVRYAKVLESLLLQAAQNVGSTT